MKCSWFAGAAAALALSPLSSSATGQPAQILLGLGVCKQIKDEGARLKCYDAIVNLPASGKKDDDAESEADQAPTWKITESKAPLDDSPQVSAIMLRKDGAAIVARCQEHHTEFIFSPNKYLGSQRGLRVNYRINDDKPVSQTWSPSGNGQAAFSPTAIPLMLSLPDNASLYIRVYDFSGSQYDATFKIGEFTAVRDQIRAACRWPAQKSAPSVDALSAAPKKHPKPAAASPIKIGQ